MATKKDYVFNRLTNPLLSEYPFFLFSAAMFWQNTLFALREWTFWGVTQYTFLSLFYAYLLTILVHSFHSKWLKGLMYAIGIIICFINIYLRLCFSSNISPNIFLLVFETNSQEASEFLSNYVWQLSTLWLLVLLLVTVAAIIITEKYKHVIKLSVCWFLNLIPITIITGGLISLLFYTNLFKCKNVIEVDHWVATHGAKAMDNLSNIIYCIYDIYLCNLEIERAVESTRRVMAERTICEESDSLNIVLVVGETYIKWHASVYGYANNTTPHMQEEYEKGNLFLFQDVVSPYNFTSKTLRNVFSTNCNSLGESWADYPYFPTIFRHAGYEVYFWDNQYNPVSREGFDFTLNAYLHNQIISSMTYTATNRHTCEVDGELVDDFIDNNVSSIGRLNLSVFHLMGQHVAYYNRFPHGGAFDYFSGDSIRRTDSYLTSEKRQLIADYDNATRYNDFVVYSIIQHFRQKNSVVIYFSDHGEEVYDYQDFRGRNWKVPITYHLLHYQFEVPFMIWCSDTFMNKNPKVVEQIVRAVNRPFMLDNVCHLLFHLGRVQTQYYHPERDILNDAYSCPPRIVNDRFSIEDVKSRNNYSDFSKMRE